MAIKKLALITGVSREMGLGFETARQLVEQNYQVIITARDYTKAKILAEKINALAMELDTSSEQSVAALASEVKQQFGKLDVLVNNAAAYFDQGANPLATDMQFVMDAFDTNLLGAWRMVNAFLPLLKRSEAGRIVNVSSGAGSFKDPVFGLGIHQAIVPVYSLTKLALNGLTVQLARALADTPIKINAVCPGFVATYPGTAEWGARPVADGAKSIVWAIELPEDGPSGGFFRDGKKLDW